MNKNKEKISEIVKRLNRLKRHIERDLKIINDIKQKWYLEYAENTGTMEFLEKHNLVSLGLSVDDIKYDDFPIDQINGQICVVTDIAMKELDKQIIAKKIKESI